MAGRTTLPNDEKEAQDSDYNPGEQAYREGIGAGAHDRIPGYDRSADGLDDHPVSGGDASADDPTDKVREAEGKGDWRDNTSKEPQVDKTRLQKALGFAKKRGAIFGIAGLLGVGGVFVGGFLGPSSMLISVMEGFTKSNDSSATSLERRFMKVFGYATKGDPICENTTKISIRCKMGRISNSALSQLAKKGVIAFDENGPMDISKKGYPKKNPTGYSFDFKDGTGVKNVPIADVPGFLANNPKAAAKILGTAGAFNLKVKAWSGKYITSKLFSKFNIKKSGGLADGDNRGKKYSDILKKIRAKIPGLEKLSGVADGVSKKIDKHLGSAKKGGAGYTVAVASCIAVKAPGYIAAGVAAVQLAQIMPIVMDVVLSPASALKASGVDPASNFSGEDMSAIGGVLTNQTPRESDGKLTSALDSAILLSAMGVNKGKPPIAASITPGYSVLTSQLVLDANKLNQELAPACNGIMSPAAMYTAMAVDAAITVAASATIVGGIVKIIGGLAVSEVTGKIASQVAGDTARSVVTDLATNDAIPKAEGEALGDVIGVSALTFFPAGSMSRNIPVLKQGEQLHEFSVIQKENEAFQREMDIASLSPFDTSSKYTFMGSIVNSMQTAALANGVYSNSLVSMISSVAKLPLFSLTSKAGAEGFNDSSCGYAADYGLTTENPDDTPAINAAGLPCTGLTAEQSSMSTETAINLTEGQGWLDESKTIKDSATITDLVTSGYIKADTPLADYINNCGDPTTGDYLFNAAGCTINTVLGNTQSVTDKLNSAGVTCDDQDAGCLASSSDESKDAVTDARALVAIPVFLLDFQSIQSVNGEDESTGTTSADTVIDQGAVFEDSTNIECADGTTDAGQDIGYHNGTPVNIQLCSIPNTSDSSHGGSPVIVNSRISGAALALTTELASELGVSNLKVADGFRTMSEQQQALDEYGPDRASQPGYSNHQMGLAIDFQLSSNTGATKPGDKTYDWLAKNANGFGFSKISGESWHWQATGAL